MAIRIIAESEKNMNIKQIATGNLIDYQYLDQFVNAESHKRISEIISLEKEPSMIATDAYIIGYMYGKRDERARRKAADPKQYADMLENNIRTYKMAK